MEHTVLYLNYRNAVYCVMSLLVVGVSALFYYFFLFLAIVYQVGRSDLFFRLTEFYIIVAFCHISSNPLR